MTNLFQTGNFTLSSGGHSAFKIECDAFTDNDWETLASLIAPRVREFSEVVGVPRGGIKLAEKLQKYRTKRGGRFVGQRLVVDDVWTTGGSMRKLLCSGDIGFVVFARGPLDSNVGALFILTPEGSP